MEIGEFGRNLLGKLLMLKRMQLRCVDLDQFAADLRKGFYKNYSLCVVFKNFIKRSQKLIAKDLSKIKSKKRKKISLFQNRSLIHRVVLKIKNNFLKNFLTVEFLPTSEQTENPLSKAQPLQKSAMQDSIQNDPNMVKQIFLFFLLVKFENLSFKF